MALYDDTINQIQTHASYHRQALGRPGWQWNVKYVGLYNLCQPDNFGDEPSMVVKYLAMTTHGEALVSASYDTYPHPCLTEHQVFFYYSVPCKCSCTKNALATHTN